MMQLDNTIKKNATNTIRTLMYDLPKANALRMRLRVLFKPGSLSYVFTT